MRRFITPQGDVAIVRPLKNNKASVRIRNSKGITVVSKVVDESDVGGVLNQHGEYWKEQPVLSC